MKSQRTLSQTIPFLVAATGLILLVPFIAMQFTTEVAWSALDFVVAGVLIFSTGLSMIVLLRRADNLIYKLAIGIVVGAAFLMIWANLAVGLIGSGPNPANLMYIGVLIVLIAGIVRSRLRVHRLQHAAYATAGALGVVAAIALLMNMQHTQGSSVFEIIGVNGFFAALFVIAGLLLRFVNQTMSRTA